MSNPFDPGNEVRAIEPNQRIWTEAETCEAWGGCDQHPVPPVDSDAGRGTPPEECA